jgi:copper transport protein
LGGAPTAAYLALQHLALASGLLLVMSRTIRNPRLAVAALFALALLVPAVPASAHAVLEQTSPARGVTVDSQPKLVQFRFSEPVEGSFGAVRVFNAQGDRVDDDNIVRPKGDDTVGVGLRDGIPDGTYTSTFRVISADGHPVAGGFVFSIGAPGVPGKSVAELTAASEVGTVTDIGFGLARGVTYAAIALAIGSLVFLLAIWLPALRLASTAAGEWLEASRRFAKRLRQLLLLALIAGVVGEAAQIVFQGATGAGTTFWSALDTNIIQDVLDTRYGTVRLFACGAFLGALVLFSARGWVPALRPATVGAQGLAGTLRLEAPTLVGAALFLGFIAISSALAGHASTQSPRALLIPTDVLHVLAMSVWVGGLVALVAVLPAATRALSTTERTRLLAGVVSRFSPLALAAVCVLMATGIVQSIVHLDALDNLLHTAFGRAILIKIGLLLLLIGLGAYNQRRVLPRLRAAAASGQAPGAVGLALRRSLRAEVALLVVVLGVTSLLVSYSPPTSARSGPFSTTQAVGPLELQSTVDPAEVGRNEMHFYLFRARDGAQFDGTKEFKVRMALPGENIGPIAVRAVKGGPGHYVVPAADFGVSGDWQVKLTGRVSEFDQYETTVKVPIR